LLNAVLFFGVFMVALPWLAHWLFPSPLPVPVWLRVPIGSVLFVSGLVVWAICLDVFSRRGRGTPFPLDAPRELVTTGPFAEVAVIWGEAAYVASVGMLVYAVAITLLGHFAVVRMEEPELRERFGDEYDAYCRRVPRWLPKRRRSG